MEIASKSKTSEQRVSSHTHVKGLGLDEKGMAVASQAGFVGQSKAVSVCVCVCVCVCAYCVCS